MRPLVAHCHLGLGTLYRPHGRRASRPRSTSRPRPRCTARWAWGSGWSRRSHRSRDRGADELSALRLRESASDGVLRALRSAARGTVPVLRLRGTPRGSPSAAGAARAWPQPRHRLVKAPLISLHRSLTPRSTSPRRSSPRRRRSKASASRSPCSSPTSRARWSCSPTAIPRRRGSSSTRCSSG